MGGFHYAYQKIVDLKGSERTQAEWLLTAAVVKLRQEEASLGRLREEREAWIARLQQASGTAVPLVQLLTMQQYVDYLDGCIARKLADVSEAEREVDRKRSALSTKMKDEQIWQKSKDNALQLFRAAMQSKEQGELDEMAAVRFAVSAP
ncbi:flagellar export protein FliJ [Paenibacillus humicola]|uniref:flagellar export protein FliJ n=1 Tax=Paenibacillus humicola TaxID=3110540 RepID=UPI00237C2260|nr:flagellar export protein FliJ [Paenibacillus humicola]